MPNLVLSNGVSVPGSCSPGQSVEVDYTVANTGPDDAANVTVALSVSDSSGSEVTGADQSVGNIAAGSDSGSLSWYFTPDTAGSYTVYVAIYDGEHQSVTLQCN